MANISITSECNRGCAYCFARGAFDRGTRPGAAAGPMSPELFRRVLGFLRRSQIDQVRLLGGEPTLHPLFREFVEEALEEGFRVLVFSNGLIPGAVLKLLSSLTPEQVLVLINTIPPGSEEEDPRAEIRQRASLRLLGKRAMVGLNIHSPYIAGHMDFLFDLVETFDLRPAVRLGLAHPGPSETNTYLNPRYYPSVGARVFDFVRQAETRDITVEFDCGFVPCMFAHLENPGEFDMVAAAFEGRCNPILDILPDGTVISCYALAHLHREPLPEKATAKQLRNRFASELEIYSRLGLYRDCAQCPLQEQGVCTRGCRAAAIKRLMPPAAKTLFEKRVPDSQKLFIARPGEDLAG